MECGEQVTNWHYVIQSSFALHSLHFELSRVSLSVSFDSLSCYLFLRQSSITVHIRRSTHLQLVRGFFEQNSKWWMSIHT